MKKAKAAKTAWRAGKAQKENDRQSLWKDQVGIKKQGSSGANVQETQRKVMNRVFCV